MEFRKTRKDDLPEIMPMIHEAQQKFRAQGISQWVDGYPDAETISSDVDKGESYVLADEKEIVASTVISSRQEVTYRTIHEGEWLSDADYLVVHRLVVKEDRKNERLASLLLQKTEEIAEDLSIMSIKIDTHEENLPMQNLLKKNSYEYCGVIYLEDGSKRLAYEKKRKVEASV
ncbi:GNAT family N-acetyltransferase [Salimicrobium flavidum]|uniref:Acetyltransferase (GNAT) family protein n=1 Tax=Salimicrobium flavidum TaxID=570947 RepID=A0A1N7K6S2_9BACI|nr:GNAT family N-acetyltransferase [Salimicrobium flavidum]SIS57256.1 Acetyltransferase (GNAT) family protein [Salimicrobium flavidum]